MRLAGRKAKWAGDDLNPPQGYRTTTRNVWLLFVDRANDRRKLREPDRFKNSLVAVSAKYGVKLTAIHEYLYDPGSNQIEVSTRIADMRDRGVTTFIGFWDTLSPILFTREMTNQRWFPENLVTGSGLSDTTTA